MVTHQEMAPQSKEPSMAPRVYLMANYKKSRGNSLALKKWLFGSRKPFMALKLYLIIS